MEGNIVDIPLKGIARAGSNQSCEDGLCNEVIGLEWKDGSYTPIQSVSGQINWLSTDVEEAWIHKTSYGDNLIVREKNNVFKYYKNCNGNANDLITISDTTHHYKIDILGNMLRINDNIFLYNGEEYKNQNIGDIDFSMQLGVRRNGIAVLHRYYDRKIQQDFNDIGESWFQTASKSMLKQLESEVKEKGYFTGMAYMRYALKLYDGTYIHLSNPVLVSDNFFNFDGTNDKHEGTLDLKKGEAKEYISVMKYMGYLVNMGWAFTTKYQRFDNDDGYPYEFIKPQDLIYSNRTFLMENFPFRSYGGIDTMKWSDDGEGVLDQKRNEKEYDKDPFYHHLTEDFEGKSTDAIKKIGDLFLPTPHRGSDNPTSQIWAADFSTSDSENWFAWKTDGDIGNITTDFEYNVNINPEFCYYANGLGLVYDSGNKIDADKKDYQFFGMRGLATPILSIIKNLDEEWKNIVTSVDVFMTRPVDLFKNEMGVNRRIYKDGSIIKEELHNSLHSFYKILEIPFDDLLKFNSNEIYVPYIESARIAQIEQQETLDQNYPHTDYYKKSYMYNGRLHISDLKTKYKKGFSVDSVSILNREEEPMSRTLCVRVTIEENGKVDYVDSMVKIEKEYFSYDINGAIVYPNENAKSIEFLGMPTLDGKYKPFKDKHIYPLKPYNGFAINTTLGYINFSEWGTSTLSSYPKFNEKEITDRDKNIFKVSSANNLINFPLINTYQVGNGDIIGFASSTRALSQGQFGQYPLYVFTTEGIYAMEQNTTGTYSSSQPISREVCCNPNGILQLDGSVLFTTTKGLMLLSGTEVVPFAPLLVGEVGLKPQPSIIGAGEAVYLNAITDTRLVTMQNSISMSDFRDYVSDLDTRLSYIYDKNKVLVYNKNHNYSYLIDLQTQITTKIGEQILFDDGNYPTSSYAMSNGSNIELKTIPYKLDNGYTQTMFQTRPIKLGTYDLKSSFRVVLRGKFDVESNKYAGLYILGSNDTERWMYLGGIERGGSFYDLGTTIQRVSCKYLMVIYVGCISHDSKINGLEISSNVKYNNKLK